MNTFAAKKMLFAAPLLAVAAAWALSSSPAEAAPAAISNCTYYNNAAHTKVVGQFGYDCCNNPVAWGKKSQFSQCGGCFICFPPPPQ